MDFYISIIKKLIINSLLFIMVGASYAQEMPTDAEPSEQDFIFIKISIISSFQRSDYYQAIAKECQELSKEEINPVHCEVLEESLEDAFFEFKIGGFLQNHSDDIAVVGMYHLEGSAANIQKHLFLFLRQDDGTLKQFDNVVLPSSVRGVKDFKIENNIITVQAKELAENDHHWFPSITKILQYGIKDKKLTKLETE